MGILRVQGKKTKGYEVLFIHLPKEWTEKLGIKKGDYIIWEIDRKNRLILRKLR